MKASRVIMVKNRLERLTHEREEDTTMIKILLVEDDLGLSNSVFDFLDDFADVMQVFDGEEGLYEAESGIYDLILLDLMLPEKDGFHVLKELREKGVTTPVLIMTAKESLDEKGHGFELGADDYLTKPFHLAELNARIKSVIRRKQQDGELQLSLANLTIYPDKHSVYINGKEIVLNRKEFDLLYYFISNPNRLISKATLAESVWGDYIDQADNFDFIYSQVKNLRKKLKAAGAIPEIKAVYGFGYKMTDEE